jgi:putative colanic acid biosynthesis acetyltransferase WcaF
MTPIDLGKFDNSWYRPGRSRLVQATWFFFGLPILRCTWLPFSGIRCALLRLFGARVGYGVIVKPGVRVKYPWLLKVGHDTWLGEDVWLDNLAPIEIGSNVCISQGAYLCTGNHDWADPAFGLVIRPITVGDGAWIGARVLLCPGVDVAESAVAAAGSIVVNDLEPYTVYAGNPAVAIRTRKVRSPGGTNGAE